MIIFNHLPNDYFNKHPFSIYRHIFNPHQKKKQNYCKKKKYIEGTIKNKNKNRGFKI
jgi:hypothetical protein